MPVQTRTQILTKTRDEREKIYISRLMREFPINLFSAHLRRVCRTKREPNNDVDVEDDDDVDEKKAAVGKKRSRRKNLVCRVLLIKRKSMFIV